MRKYIYMRFFIKKYYFFSFFYLCHILNKLNVEPKKILIQRILIYKIYTVFVNIKTLQYDIQFSNDKYLEKSKQTKLSNKYQCQFYQKRYVSNFAFYSIFSLLHFTCIYFLLLHLFFSTSLRLFLFSPSLQTI